jgi:Per1-like family
MIYKLCFPRRWTRWRLWAALAAAGGGAFAYHAHHMLFVLFDYGWNVTLCIAVGLAQVRDDTSWVPFELLVWTSVWSSPEERATCKMLACCDLLVCKHRAACKSLVLQTMHGFATLAADHLPSCALADRHLGCMGGAGAAPWPPPAVLLPASPQCSHAAGGGWRLLAMALSVPLAGTSACSAQRLLRSIALPGHRFEHHHLSPVHCQLSARPAPAQVLDFPPLLGLLDAHAAWHAATVCSRLPARWWPCCMSADCRLLSGSGVPSAWI